MTQPETKNRFKVWDIGTRLFHWILVVLFCLSAYSAFQDKFGIYADMHLYSGVGILALLGWRILWGLFGSETSRFSQFVPSPKRLIEYVKTGETKQPGHNPLGALSVILVLLLLVVQVTLGLYSSDGMLFSGPFASSAYETFGMDANDITNIHETLGYILFGWSGLHLASVLFYAVVRKRNLLMPMITGKSALPEGSAQPKIVHPLLAALCLSASGLAAWWYVIGF